MEFNFRERFKESINIKTYKFLAIQVVFFAVIAAGFFYSNNKTESIKDITQKLGLLIIPLLFVFSGNIFKHKQILILKLFIISNLVFSLICLAVALVNSLHFQGYSLIYDAMAHSGNRFYYSRLSIFQHPSYFSMFIVFSLASMFHLKDNDIFKKSIRNLIIYYSLMLFFFIMIFLLSSRAGISSGLLLSAVRLMQNVFRYKRLFFKIVILVLFFSSVVIVFKNPRVNSKINLYKTAVNDKSTNKSLSARVVFWTTALQIIEDNFFVGTGNGDAQDVFDRVYEENGNGAKKYIGYNVHNQFLELTMTSGILGFVSLMLIFSFAVEKAVKENRQLFLSFLAIIGFNFLFESMLNTMSGLFFFSFFLNYFLFVLSDE